MFFKPQVQKDYEERLKNLDKREEAFEERVESWDRDISRDNEDKEYSDSLVLQYNNLQDEIERSDSELCTINKDIEDAEKSCKRAGEHAFKITEDAKNEAKNIVEVAKAEHCGRTNVAEALLKAEQESGKDVVTAQDEMIEALREIIKNLTGTLPNINLDTLMVTPQQGKNKDKK